MLIFSRKPTEIRLNDINRCHTMTIYHINEKCIDPKFIFNNTRQKKKNLNKRVNLFDECSRHN